MRRLATLIIESVTISVWESHRRFESVEEGGVELNQGWAVSDGNPGASRIYSSAKVLSAAALFKLRFRMSKNERLLSFHGSLICLRLSLSGGHERLTRIDAHDMGQAIDVPHRGNAIASRHPRPIAGL